MQFSKIEAIKSRRSVRTFTNDPLTPEDIGAVKQYLNHIIYEMGPFGNRAEFYYSRVSNNITSKGEKVGTYGIIKNASAYIVSACKNSRENLIDLGYLFEKVVIFLEDKNIGTCWLGGTFNRNMFHKKFDVHSSKLIPAISPIGYPKEKQRFFESTMRKLVQADNRLPWEMLFFDKDFSKPLSHNKAGKYDMILEMVRRGPSASNKQPWRVVYDPMHKLMHFYLAHTPNYSDKLPFNIQYLDIGIAMYHFEAAALESDIEIKWVHETPPDIEMPDTNHEYVATAILSK